MVVDPGSPPTLIPNQRFIRGSCEHSRESLFTYIILLMIYFLYGDPGKIFQKSKDLIDNIVKKNPEADFFKLDEDSFYNFNITELISGQSLFTGKQIIYMKRLFEKTEISKGLLGKIKEISNSDNIFIIAEEKLKKPDFNKIEKNSEKTQIFEIKKETKKPKDNIFDLANCLGDKDVKKLWSLYNEKIKTSRPEEIHGILWWQIKSMLISRKTDSAKETGLNPFVFKKTKVYNSKYSDLEIEKMSNDLISMVHDSRRSGLGLDLALEKFILKL